MNFFLTFVNQYRGQLIGVELFSQFYISICGRVLPQPQTTTMLRFVLLLEHSIHPSQFLTNYVLVLQLQLLFTKLLWKCLTVFVCFTFFFTILNIGLTSYEMCCFICMCFMFCCVVSSQSLPLLGVSLSVGFSDDCSVSGILL